MSSDITVPRTLPTAISGVEPGRSESKATKRDKFTALVAKVAFAEFLTVFVAAYAISLVYFVFVFEELPPVSYGAASLGIASLILVVSLGFRHYATLQTQPRHRFLWSGLGAVALAFSFFLSALFVLRATGDYSRATFFIQLVAAATAVLGVRAFSYSIIRKAIASGRVQARRIVLIGNKANYSAIDDQLREAGIQTVRSLPFPRKPRSPANGSEITLDYEHVRQIIETCRKLQPDDVVILATAADLPRSARLADTLSELPVSVHVIPAETRELLGSARLGDLGTLVTIQLFRAPLSAIDRLLKRGFDIVAAIAGLVLLSPLLLIVAIAIKLESRGPVLFRQTRHGYNNDPIRVLKFRSMMTMEDGQAFRQATKNDPRVTRVGRVIRRTNIDELPQLINVLLGEMSVVGPRPHPVAMNEMFQKHISPLSRRHNVKPGITGWAQVNGYRGQTDTLEKMQRRFECDLYYIDNWSLLLDIKIILMTLLSKRAYTNAM